MNINQLNIYFYVRPSSIPTKRGTFNTRVVINGKQIVCAVKSLKIYPEQFDNTNQTPKKNCELYHECNSFMLNMRRELFQIHQEIEKKQQVFTKDQLVSAIEDVYYRVKNGHKARSKTFIEVYDLFLANESKGLGRSISKGTHDVRCRYKKIFIHTLGESRLSATPLCNFDEKEVRTVQDWLKSNYSIGTASRVFSVFSMVFKFAIKLNEISENPCKIVGTIKKPKSPNLIWLEQEEVIKLMDLDLNGSIDRYRDAFIFCCYTGLSIGDYELLNPKRAENLIKSAQSPVNIDPGKIVNWKSGDFLEGRRRKTGTKFRIPLMPEARKILKKYGGIENLPYILNKSGYLLQTLATMAGIKKIIRFHTARKSMANYLINVKMMNPFYVKEVMGWISIEEATQYTIVNNDTLAAQLLDK